MKALIAYLSYSGNTLEVAEIIGHILESANITVEVHEIGVDPPVDAAGFDFIFIGTFTWGYGKTPDEVKDFILEIGYKPENVCVFGTGDTQFGGEDLFCLAAEKLARFYHSKHRALKIEQSPRGMQETLIWDWMKGVLVDVKSYAYEGKNIGTT